MPSQAATTKHAQPHEGAPVSSGGATPLSTTTIDRSSADASTIESAQRDRADLLERVQALHRAMHGGLTGLGTDEAALFRALENLSPDQVRELRATYLEHYGTELDADIRSELSGAELGRAEALLKGDTVAATADALASAMAGVGTDEDALRSTLKNYTGDRAALERTFQQRHGTSLSAALHSELSGDDLIELEALRRGDNAAAAAARIHAAIDGLGTDEATLKQTLADLSPEDRRRVGAIYRERYGHSLESALEGDLSGLDLDQARALRNGDLTTAAAARVKAALNAGSAHDLIAEFTGKSEQERDAIIAAYDRRYGAGMGDKTRLFEQLKTTLSAADLDRVESAIETGHVSLAQRLHAAVDGLGTGADIGDLLKELGGLSASEARAVATEYERRYNEPLATALEGDLSGRLAFDAALYINGLPADPMQREIALAKRHIAQIEHDRSSGIANGIVDLLSDHGERADSSVARLRAIVKQIERGGTPSAADMKALRELNSWAASSLQDVRDAKDSAANAAATAGATVAAGVAIVATAGAATPLVVAAATGAGAIGYTGAKALAQGSDYETDGIGADLASGAVEGAANVVGAGIAAKAVATLPKGALGRAVGFIAEGAIDAGIGGAAGGATQVGLTKETWEHGVVGGLAAIGHAALEQGAVGAVTGVAMKGSTAAIGAAGSVALGAARRSELPDIRPTGATPEVRVNGRMVPPDHAMRVQPGETVMIGAASFRIPKEYVEYASGDCLSPDQFKILTGKPLRLGSGPNADIKIDPATSGGASVYLVRGPDKNLYLRQGEPPPSARPEEPIDPAHNDARTFIAADRRRDRGYVPGEHGAPDFYLGRPVIGRGTPIDGGVSTGAGFREAIVVDFSKDRTLEGAYREFVDSLPTRIAPGSEGFNRFVLKKLEAFADRKFGGQSATIESDLDALLRIKDISNDQKVNLGLFLNEGTGVCRHRALLAGAILERMIKEGRLDGAVEIRRNARNGGAHAWAVFTDTSGDRTVLDPMQRYIGPEGALPHGWDYGGTGDNALARGAGEPATQMVVRRSGKAPTDYDSVLVDLRGQIEKQDFRAHLEPEQVENLAVYLASRPGQTERAFQQIEEALTGPGGGLAAVECLRRAPYERPRLISSVEDAFARRNIDAPNYATNRDDFSVRFGTTTRESQREDLVRLLGSHEDRTKALLERNLPIEMPRSAKVTIGSNRYGPENFQVAEVRASWEGERLVRGHHLEYAVRYHTPHANSHAMYGPSAVIERRLPNLVGAYGRPPRVVYASQTLVDSGDRAAVERLSELLERCQLPGLSVDRGGNRWLATDTRNTVRAWLAAGEGLTRDQQDLATLILDRTHFHFAPHGWGE
jgi:hypothetical protein